MFEDIQPEPDWEKEYKELEEILKENGQVIRNLQDENFSTEKLLRKYSRYVEVCRRFSKRMEKELGTDKYDKICDEVLDKYKKEISFDLEEEDN